MDFTFLTSTIESPAPGKFRAKEMRAHVTRTNFARRRKRIAQESQEKRKQKTDQREIIQTQAGHPRNSGSRPNRIAPAQLALLVGPTDPDLPVRSLLRGFRPILDASAEGGVMTDKEAAWFNLVRSEPALLEATLSLASRAGNGIPTRIADLHTSRAVSIINKRLEQGVAALTDGVLGAVFTLAYCERVAQNEAVWNVHVDGLAQMLKIRRSNDQLRVPSWFSDLLLYDAINERVAIGSALHEKIVYSLAADDSQILLDVAHISDAISHIRQAMDLSYQYDMPPEYLLHEIDEPLSVIEADAYAIRGQKLYIDALSIGIVIFLHLSWERSPLSTVTLGAMSNDLMETLGKHGTPLCASLDLTTWQLMVGGISATEFTTRQWFVSMLRKYFAVLHIRTWEHAVKKLGKTFMPDSRLMSRFKAFWDEVDWSDSPVVQEPDSAEEVTHLPMHVMDRPV